MCFGGVKSCGSGGGGSVAGVLFIPGEVDVVIGGSVKGDESIGFFVELVKSVGDVS